MGPYPCKNNNRWKVTGGSWISHKDWWKWTVVRTDTFLVPLAGDVLKMTATISLLPHGLLTKPHWDVLPSRESGWAYNCGHSDIMRLPRLDHKGDMASAWIIGITALDLCVSNQNAPRPLGYEEAPSSPGGETTWRNPGTTRQRWPGSHQLLQNQSLSDCNCMGDLETASDGLPR